MQRYKTFNDARIFSLVFAVMLAFFAGLPPEISAQGDAAARARQMAEAGIKHFNQDTPESNRLAIVELNRAIQLYQEAKMPVDAVETKYLLGIAAVRAKSPDDALKTFQEIETEIKNIITNASAVPNPQEVIGRVMFLAAATEIQKGYIFVGLGEMDKSTEALTDALSFYRDLGVIPQEIETLKTIGDVYNHFGEKIKAIDNFKLALETAKKFGDKANQSFLLNYIGKQYNDLQENEQALRYFLPALALRRELKDRAGEGQTLANLGRVYSDTAEYQKALENLLKALPIRREFEDRAGEAITLNNIGMVYLSLGENQKALEYFTLSAPIFKKTQDVSGEATALSNIGLIYNKLGNSAKAFEYFNRVLVVRRESSDKAGEALALNNLANLYAEKGEFQKALELFGQAKAIYEEINNRNGKAVTALNIGTLYVGAGTAKKDAGQIRQGIVEFQNALTLTKATGDKNAEADALGKIMDGYDALQYAEKNGEINYLRTAVVYGKMAVNRLQELRRNVDRLDTNTQKVFLKKIENAYRSLAGKLMKSGRLSEAQQVLDAFKDQQFFDFDRTPTKAAAPLALTPREAEFIAILDRLGAELGTIGEKLFEFEKRLGADEPTVAEKTAKGKLDTDFTRSAVLFGVLLGNGELDFGSKPDAKDKTPQISGTTEMQSILRDMSASTGQKTVAVYQLADQDEFRVLLISADSITTVSTPFKKELLDEQALNFWGLLQSPNYDPTGLGKKIYDEIFQPLEKVLPPDTKTIIWSLDGNLRYVPMSALFDGKKYLVERYNNVLFTRFDRNRLTRSVSPVWTGIGFGSTKAQTVSLADEKFFFNALPGVSEELQGIFKTSAAPDGVLGGAILPDGKFTKPAMLAALKTKYPLVHIASHFSFRPGDESRSFLLMGDGSAFTLDEMKAEANLFAGVELLTLSACNTAAQRADAVGREIDGFAELAQRLGAGAVMATLWSVADSSTPQLMKDFYAARQAQTGTTKAEALRQAQIALLNGTVVINQNSSAEKAANKSPVIVVTKDGKRDATRSDVIFLSESDAQPFVKNDKKPFSHPFYWSPFVLIGNWR